MLRVTHTRLVPVSYPGCVSPSDTESRGEGCRGQYRIRRCPIHGTNAWMVYDKTFVCCANAQRGSSR